MLDSTETQRWILYCVGWFCALCMAYSFYRWRQRKYWSIRASYIAKLDEAAQGRPLTADERKLRASLLAENQKHIRFKPRAGETFEAIKTL